MSGTRGIGALGGAGWHLASGFKRRLTANAWSILQAFAAGYLVYFLASSVVDGEQPFCVALAAIVTLSLAPGEHGPRAFDEALRVSAGIRISNVAVRIIGDGASRGPAEERQLERNQSPQRIRRGRIMEPGRGVREAAPILRGIPAGCCRGPGSSPPYGAHSPFRVWKVGRFGPRLRMATSIRFAL